MLPYKMLTQTVNMDNIELSSVGALINNDFHLYKLMPSTLTYTHMPFSAQKIKAHCPLLYTQNSKQTPLCDTYSNLDDW